MATAKGKGLSGLLAGLRKKGKATNTPESWSAPSLSLAPAFSVGLGRHHFVFGLVWQLYTDQKELSGILRASQSQGYTHYALSSSGDGVGVGRVVDKTAGPKPLSAAIHLAETFSLGGLELFLFELPNGLVSLIALNDSQPVSHFDQVGTKAEVLGLVTEYRALQSDQPIRYVGNVDLIEGLEQMQLTDAFARPDSAAQLLALPNYKLRKLIAVIVVPSLLVAGAGVAWVEHQRQIEEQERLAREQDPNYIYENAVGPAMQQTGLQAQITLERWREVIFRIPTERAGWKLEKITCQPTNCSVVWKRDFGSYQDFHADPIDGTKSSNEAQNGDSPANANITTDLPIPVLPGEAKGLVRPNLPGLRDTLKQIASQLQDISLVEKADVKLKKPELYPATGATIEQINNPVAKGEWSLTHELWTLGDLSFDQPNLVMQSLTIQQDEKTKNWTYTLTGNYYAKGKSN